MYSEIRLNDVDAWAASFMRAINGNLTNPLSNLVPAGMGHFNNEHLSKCEGDAEKLALILDYDGNLTPLNPQPDLAIKPNKTGHLFLDNLWNVDNIKNMSILENLDKVI